MFPFSDRSVLLKLRGEHKQRPRSSSIATECSRQYPPLESPYTANHCPYDSCLSSNKDRERENSHKPVLTMIVITGLMTA